MSVQGVGDMVRVLGVEDRMHLENVMQMGTVGLQEVGEEKELFTVMLQGSVTGVMIVPTAGVQGIVELLLMTRRVRWMTLRQLRGSRSWLSRRMLSW